MSWTLILLLVILVWGFLAVCSWCLVRVNEDIKLKEEDEEADYWDPTP